MGSLETSSKEGRRMTVHVRVSEDGLEVSGELDMASAEDFREFAKTVVDSRREVVLDVADLAFLDTSGVRAILRLAETTCPNGLVLRWPRDNVLRALEILGVEEVRGIRIQRRPAGSG
jgi:anti-anti-sigma factor